MIKNFTSNRLELKEGLGIAVARTEIKFSDPRKLILDSLARVKCLWCTRSMTLATAIIQ